MCLRTKLEVELEALKTEQRVSLEKLRQAAEKAQQDADLLASSKIELAAESKKLNIEIDNSKGLKKELDKVQDTLQVVQQQKTSSCLQVTRLETQVKDL